MCSDNIIAERCYCVSNAWLEEECVLVLHEGGGGEGGGGGGEILVGKKRK